MSNIEWKNLYKIYYKYHDYKHTIYVWASNKNEAIKILLDNAEDCVSELKVEYLQNSKEILNNAMLK